MSCDKHNKIRETFHIERFYHNVGFRIVGSQSIPVGVQKVSPETVKSVSTRLNNETLTVHRGGFELDDNYPGTETLPFLIRNLIVSTSCNRRHSRVLSGVTDVV